MRIELVRDLGIEPTNYEKNLHIAFVDQNLINEKLKKRNSAST